MTKKKKINTRNTPIRERILETATRLFFLHGIQAVGVDKIVSEARIAKMTLYSYFASKDDLVLEYLQTSSAAWLDYFHQYLNSKSSSDEERLIHSFTFIKDDFYKNEYYRGSGFVNAATEISNPADPAHGIILDHQENLRMSFENWAFNSGLKEARAFSYVLINLFNGTITSSLIEDFPEPATHTIATVKQLITLHKAL